MNLSSRLLSAACCTLLVCSLPALPASAQRGGMNGLHMPGNVALSPDGATVAWTLRSRDGSTLHLSTATTSSDDRTVAVPNASGCAYSSPIWSPDGQTLAFLATCGDEPKDPTVPRQSQVFLWSKSTGNVRQLTHVTGDINQPAW